MTRLVLATHNQHKVSELQRILVATLAARGIDLVAASDFPDVAEEAEIEVSFVGNARLKAAALARATGLAAVADDSGLCVDVLGGSPGIFSARWSGAAYAGSSRAERDKANCQLLLDQLIDVPDEHRGAAFRCAAVLVLPDGREAVAEGEIRGALQRKPRGSDGFGYDPIFTPKGDSRTLAEYAPEEKDEVSHRARAFRALEPMIRDLLT